MSRKKPQIGITLGDCAGIGPEVAELAMKSNRLAKSAKYKIIGRYPECSLGKPTTET
jgi:4-hydroxy-L-threonine phosphate dehydrogenase PdxA